MRTETSWLEKLELDCTDVPDARCGSSLSVVVAELLQSAAVSARSGLGQLAQPIPAVIQPGGTCRRGG